MKVYASYSEGKVGIWWYTSSKEFWGYSTSLDDGFNDGNYIQYSDISNHLNLWKPVVKLNTKDDEFNEIYSRGYKSLERGRVIFNLRTQCFEILCSDKMYNDKDFRAAIIKEFNLSGNRYDFVPMRHYQVSELTGNPQLDDVYYAARQVADIVSDKADV
jgi:hypothetical protein